MKDVLSKVNQILSDALGVDIEEIEADASLIDDLGAESLDFLDITFKLDKEFGIKLYRGVFLEKAQEVLGSDLLLVEDGLLTKHGVDLLAAYMPEIMSTGKVTQGFPVNKVQTLFMPLSWVRLVTDHLEAQENGLQITGEEFVEKWLEEYKNSLLVGT